MPNDAPRDAPPWTADAGSPAAFRHGLLAAPPSAAGLILAATAVGFGALAHDLGFTLGHILAVSVIVFALPAQVLIFDELARGAGMLAVVLAVGLTAVRLLPMTVSLMPLIRSPRHSRALHLYAVHFIAVTAWLEGNRRLPPLPEGLRLPYFAGLGTGFLLMMMAGAWLGFALAARVPPVLAAALLLMTPLYFICSLVLAARTRADYRAIVIGALSGPLVFAVLPGFDLLIAGIGGGTLAWAVSRQGRS